LALKARKILDQILADKLKELPKENPLKEEFQIAKPESLSNPPQSLAISISEPPKREETPLFDFMLYFEDKLFTEYGNTSNYYSVRKPQEPKKSSLHKEPLDPSEVAFLKRTTKELMSIISNEWLEESELSFDVIRLDSPSTSIHCQIHRDPFKARYNLVMGVNIMSTSCH
jgi:hypothetical protein